MMMRMILLGSLIALVGCSSGETSRPGTVPVKAKVLFNKTTPPVGALVVFHSTNAANEKSIGGKPFGKVAEDGTVMLTTYAQDDGVPEGDYGVTVDWRGPAKGGPKLSLGEEGGAGNVSKLKAKYGNPQQPALKATVKKGDANDFTFYVD